MAEREAEEGRESRLTHEEKVREAGQKLLREIESDQHVLGFRLERTPEMPSRRPKCWARYCTEPVTQWSHGKGLVEDDYRILVMRGYGRPMKCYYHVSCMEAMMDLPSAVGKGFALDPVGHPWNDGLPFNFGVMITKWFEHEGRIDLDVVAAFIKDFLAYEKADKAFTAAVAEWEQDHRENCGGGDPERTCECPPKPERPTQPTKPTLENYTTEEACALSAVLDHPLSGEVTPRPPPIIIVGPGLYAYRILDDDSL